ncbi:MAG: SurA N-terminal domain-containing protein, partial [Nitrospinales bacterium]
MESILMLHLVRKHADSWMIKSVLWLIVFAFVGTRFYSWGLGGPVGSRGGIVATVEGVKINQAEYEKTFNGLVDFYRQQFRNQFSQDMIKTLDLKTTALDGLIQRKLLIQEAQKQNIRVTDEELIDHIKNFPAFQQDKHFSRNIYNNYLSASRLSAREFEANQREALLLKKIEQFIKSQVKVSDSEILEAFKLEENKVKFDYIVIADDHFKADEKIAEEEKKEYYEKHKSDFRVPEQIKVQYVKLDNKGFENQIVPREEDIEDYYESQKARFYEDERFKASHILFRAQRPKKDDDSSEEKLTAEEQAAKDKAESVLKKIKEGADFAEMAEEYSEDVASGLKGGDLGFFPRGAMVPDFEKAVLALKVGEVSPLVRTPFGYHIIKLFDKKEAGIKPLEEVKDIVVQSLKTTKARQKTRRIIRRIQRSAKTDSDLARAALEEHTDVGVTDFMSGRNHNDPEIGIVPEFYNVAFALPDGEVSDPVFTAENSYIMKVIERKPSYIPEMADVQDKLEAAILKEKTKTLTTENVKVLADQ